MQIYNDLQPKIDAYNEARAKEWDEMSLEERSVIVDASPLNVKEKLAEKKWGCIESGKKKWLIDIIDEQRAAAQDAQAPNLSEAPEAAKKRKGGALFDQGRGAQNWSIRGNIG